MCVWHSSFKPDYWVQPKIILGSDPTFHPYVDPTVPIDICDQIVHAHAETQMCRHMCLHIPKLTPAEPLTCVHTNLQTCANRCTLKHV